MARVKNRFRVVVIIDVDPEKYTAEYGYKKTDLRELRDYLEGTIQSMASDEFRKFDARVRIAERD